MRRWNHIDFSRERQIRRQGQVDVSRSKVYGGGTNEMVKIHRYLQSERTKAVGLCSGGCLEGDLRRQG